MTSCSHRETINVRQIRYTQDTISDKFGDGASLQYTISMLQKNEIKPNDIPFIRVGKYNGHYRTIDNRRLYCFKSANVKKIKVKYIPSIASLEEFRNKNTSKNDGIAVTVRTESRFKKKVRKSNVFHCDLCDINVTSGNKQSHLNGRRHQTAVQIQNIQRKNKNIPNKKQNTKALNCAWKPVHKATNVKYKKVTKMTMESNSDNNRSATIKPDQADKFFHCDVCDIHNMMSLRDKEWHLNGNRHQKAVKNKNIEKKDQYVIEVGSRSANVTAQPNVDPLFHCNICDTNICSRDKEWHLKNIHKVAKNKKVAKITKNDNNGCAGAASIANKIQIKTETDKTMDTKNKKDTAVKVGKKLANVTAPPNENVSDVKHKSIAIPPFKSPTRNVAHCTDLMELKRRILQVNALNAKLKEKERQINEYEIKLKEMEKLSHVTISIDDELNKEQRSEQVINPVLIGKTVCCIFSLGALYMCVKKYTYA